MMRYQYLLNPFITRTHLVYTGPKSEDLVWEGGSIFILGVLLCGALEAKGKYKMRNTWTFLIT